MKNIIAFCLVIVAIVISLNSLPGQCAITIKSGSTTFTSLSETVFLPVTENSISVSFGETLGNRVVSVNLIFDSLVDMIAPGAEFDIATGIDGESGKVTLNFTDQNSSPIKILTTDAFSKSRGKIKILETNSNGSFSFSIKNTLTNLLIQNDTGFTNKRFKGKIKMNGTILVKQALE